MASYLFPNFLNDPEEYRQAEALWHEQWQKLIHQLGQEHRWAAPWINTAFANGTPWMDGNPIFSAVCPSAGRGIRIIQQEPSGAGKEFHSWMDTFAQGGAEEIKEFVISCSLTDETLREAMNLIRQWIIKSSGEPLTPAAETSTPG